MIQDHGVNEYKLILMTRFGIAVAAFLLGAGLGAAFVC